MKSKKVKVRAVESDDGLEFEIDGIKAKHASFKLDKDSGLHSIEFELHDETQKGLAFDLDDPIWVGEDCPCPPDPGINSDQISIGPSSHRSLVAMNSNSGRARELRYQLNFVAADGDRANCDPIIRNGGGVKT